MICLAGEAWEWYMRLPRGSIKKFDDLAKVFLARYLAIHQPKVTCEMLFDIEQVPKEGTDKFLRHDAHIKEIRTLGEFLKLARGYVHAENDARDPRPD